MCITNINITISTTLGTPGVVIMSVDQIFAPRVRKKNRLLGVGRMCFGFSGGFTDAWWLHSLSVPHISPRSS